MSRNYQTVSEAVNDLVKRGYTVNLSINAEKECFVGDQESVSLMPDELQIDEVYRFEGSTDPADEAVVFAVSSPKNHVKGILVDAFGTYSDAKALQIMERLQKRV